MAALREDKALHVIGGKLHGPADRCTHVLRAPDREDGEGQPSGPALLVLRDGRIECAVELKAGSKGFRVGSEGVDVMLDGLVGQRLRGFRGELATEVELFPSADQLLVDVGEAVEGKVPEAVVCLLAAEERR
ncbi:hypothetical protein [Streptomyces phaeochromogenes]|uniref:hypothetical protein n=1 Tax=Streptomyces phaeochromogenes TaxID=1923 RepID=UPI00399F45C8